MTVHFACLVVQAVWKDIKSPGGSCSSADADTEGLGVEWTRELPGDSAAAGGPGGARE